MATAVERHASAKNSGAIKVGADVNFIKAVAVSNRNLRDFVSSCDTNHVYSEDARMTTVTLPSGADANGAGEDAGGAGAGGLFAAGRLRSVTRPDGRMTRYDYDGDALTVTATDGVADAAKVPRRISNKRNL